MTKNFSPISKIFYILILLAVTYFMGSLSYGWSIEQTMILTGAVAGDNYAGESAWLIQLAPQALLAIAGIAMMKKQKNLFWVLVISALIVNALDAYTNIVAFQELWPAHAAKLAEIGRTANFINATKTVGYGVAFFVTWFEEGIMLCIGTALIIFTELGEEMRWNLPPFFRSFGVVTHGMGFNFSKTKRASKNGQANNMATSARSDKSNRSNVTYSNISDENENNQQYPRPARVRGE